MLGLSIEKAENEDQITNVVNILKESIIKGSKRNANFNAIKLAGLTTHNLLTEISQLSEKLSLKTVAELADQPNESLIEYINKTSKLSSQTERELEFLLRNIDILCKASYENGVRLLIDAEQTYYQRMIDMIAVYFIARYNKKDPVVYNTYQFYLKKTPNVLKEHINLALEKKIFLGAKCVRGAYIDEERRLAKQNNYPDPVHDTIQDTHFAYNSNVEMLLNLIKNQQKIAVVVASHNEDSVVRFIDYLNKHNLPYDHPNIHFGQLMGMCDHISYSLAKAGANALKYYPFGPYRETLPYLVRRGHENKGFLVRTSRERNLLGKEIKRRLSISG